MVLRLSAWGIFLLGAVGLLIHSTLLQTGHIRAGMFCFYTNLSNLLVLVYELALAIAAGFPHSAVLRLLTGSTLSFSMALCILVTHLVYQFVLVPDAKRNGKRFADFGASFGNLCVHYLTPLLVVAQWLLLADKSSLGWRSALWWLTLPLAYFAFAMLRGRSGKPIGHTRLVYPYPFLDLPRLGWRKFTGYVTGMLLSFFLLGYGMMWLGRLVGTPLAWKKRTGQAVSLVPVLFYVTSSASWQKQLSWPGTSSPSGREPLRHCGGTHQAAYRLYAPDVLRDAPPGGDFPLRRAVRGAAFPRRAAAPLLAEVLLPLLGSNEHSAYSR